MSRNIIFVLMYHRHRLFRSYLYFILFFGSVETLEELAISQASEFLHGLYCWGCQQPISPTVRWLRVSDEINLSRKGNHRHF
jgi:hypothetical protein